ncbi:MAG TPA: SMP-30/gluconolactonase/LRE family protein [Geminicoccaceae bacterium]|nr:SMP-30/gluconolactonase/LRE family protein [Geminicoccaceae bacterium]
MIDVTCVLDAKAACAESPVWVPEERALYWTDIPGRTINRFDPATGANRSWSMPEAVGCFALRKAGGLVAAMRNGFAFIDLEHGRIERLGDPEADRPENRFNDGRCDRRGRFWAGTMHEPRTRKDGSLYRLDPVGTWHWMADDVLVANGLAWSPDDRLMYWSDSRSGVVYLFDFDDHTGGIANRRVFARTTDEELGRPDGAAVDAEGGYWSARFRGGRVLRYLPDGTVDREIRLPARRVTMCAFGGPDLTTLYITTAREGMSTAELAAEPLAGGIFAAEVGVRGLVEPRFAG